MKSDGTGRSSEMGFSNGRSYGAWIRAEKRLALYIRDGFVCCYCGRALKNAAPEEVTLDHLLPRSAGGSNEATNLITACRSCNSARGDAPYADYATGGARERIETRRHQPINVPLAKAIINGTVSDPRVEEVR